MRFEESARFAAAPQRVWDVLSDWERQASWMPDVAWMRLLGAERGEGAELEVRTKVFGIPLATDRIRVTSWDPPRLLAVLHVGVVDGWGDWRLDPDGDGTRFAWREVLRMPPPVLGDLALWMYSPVQRWMLRRSIRNLRRLVEAPRD